MRRWRRSSGADGAVRARPPAGTPMRERMQSARGLVLLAALSALAGCSGDAMNALDPTRPAALSVETAAVGAAASPSQPAFDPFSDSPVTSVPMRHVIENPTL